jgi:hypothetical protein
VAQRGGYRSGTATGCRDLGTTPQGEVGRRAARHAPPFIGVVARHGFLLYRWRRRRAVESTGDPVFDRARPGWPRRAGQGQSGIGCCRRCSLIRGPHTLTTRHAKVQSAPIRGANVFSVAEKPSGKQDGSPRAAQRPAVRLPATTSSAASGRRQSGAARPASTRNSVASTGTAWARWPTRWARGSRRARSQASMARP